MFDITKIVIFALFTLINGIELEIDGQFGKIGQLPPLPQFSYSDLLKRSLKLALERGCPPMERFDYKANAENMAE